MKKTRVLPVVLLVITMITILVRAAFLYKDSPGDFNKSFDKGIKTAVVVESGSLKGNGNIWENDNGHITVITAAHVIDDPEDILVTFVDGSQVKASLEYIHEESDYAFITMEGSKKYKAVKIRKKLPKASEFVMVIDASSGTASVGSVSRPDVYVEDFGQNMIYCALDVDAGMSGSGLFDKRGNYVGILLGGSDSSEAVCLSAKEIAKK